MIPVWNRQTFQKGAFLPLPIRYSYLILVTLRLRWTSDYLHLVNNRMSGSARTPHDVLMNSAGAVSSYTGIQ